MAHVGEKGALGLVGRFGSLFRFLQLLLEPFSFGNINKSGKDGRRALIAHRLQREGGPNRGAIGVTELQIIAGDIALFPE